MIGQSGLAVFGQRMSLSNDGVCCGPHPTVTAAASVWIGSQLSKQALYSKIEAEPPPELWQVGFLF